MARTFRLAGEIELAALVRQMSERSRMREDEARHRVTDGGVEGHARTSQPPTPRHRAGSPVGNGKTCVGTVAGIKPGPSTQFVPSEPRSVAGHSDCSNASLREPEATTGIPGARASTNSASEAPLTSGGVESNATCGWCGAAFWARPDQFSRGRGRFCSVSCKAKFARSQQDQAGKNNPAYRHGEAYSQEHRLAWRAVYRAIKRGELKRGSCQVCGTDAHVHAHHDDYSKPLDVRWLCREHHREHHAAPGPLTHQRPDARASGRATRDVGQIYPLVGLCRAAGLSLPIPEYRFDTVRRYRFDYAWPLRMVAVEIDGGVWTQGRHTRGKGFIEDQRKGNLACKLGWFVLHYTPDRLGECIADLRIMFAESAA